MTKRWIIGCGDMGRRLAKLYPTQKPRGIVHSEASVSDCRKIGVEAQTLDFDKSFSLPETDFKEAEIYYFMPPPPQGRQDTRLKQFLEKVGKQPKRLVLISTTGVYGDSQGAWIDESAPLKPIADRAHRRLSAEQYVQRWTKTFNKEFMILRVPGIYAKERLPLARLQKGLPVVTESEAGWTNRIHADDLAQACKAAMEYSGKDEIINITDGHPGTMTDYFNQVADFAGLPRPPQVSMQEAEQTLSAGMVSYLKESRRIKNDKMLELLDFELKYPTLKKALK